jgi:hypothetical protein
MMASLFLRLLGEWLLCCVVYGVSKFWTSGARHDAFLEFEHGLAVLCYNMETGK